MPDPNMLRALAANPTPYPGSPPNPVNRGPGAGPGAPAPGGAPPSEAAGLSGKGKKAKETLKAARAAFEDLAADAELAENMDPALEKLITGATEQLATLDDDCEDMCTELDGMAEDHEALVKGGGPPAAPPAAPGAVKP
jgi:hypothetical protein